MSREWELGPGVRAASLARSTVPDDACACLVVAPTALDTASLNKFLAADSGSLGVDVPVILLNAQLVDLTTGAMGLEGRTLTKRVSREFTDAYMLKTIQGGAITRSYPGNFAIWREDQSAVGGYAFVRGSTAKPNVADVAEELAGPVEGGPGLFKEISSFIKGLQRL